jgi:hypothetical protein
MGHYASETPGSGWSDNIDRTARKLKLRDAVDETPLSKFKGKHFGALKRLYSYDELLPSEEELLREVVNP